MRLRLLQRGGPRLPRLLASRKKEDALLWHALGGLRSLSLCHLCHITGEGFPGTRHQARGPRDPQGALSGGLLGLLHSGLA